MNKATFNISNSEVVTFQTCQRRHYYHFALEIEPKILSLPLERGITGHKAKEFFYKARIEGKSKEECIQVAIDHIISRQVKLLSAGLGDDRQKGYLTMYTKLMSLVKNHCEYYWDENIIPLEVEQMHIVPLTSDINLGMRVDLFGQYTKYPNKGDYVVIDWKFRFNFPSRDIVELNGQLPKYIWALNEQGIIVTKGMLDILRYRSIIGEAPKDIYKRELIKVKSSVRDRIITDHIRVAERIVEKKKLPVAQYGKEAERTQNEIVCKYCPFKSICILELNGQDPTLEISTNYEPSTYGYDINTLEELLP